MGLHLHTAAHSGHLLAGVPHNPSIQQDELHRSHFIVIARRHQYNRMQFSICGDGANRSCTDNSTLVEREALLNSALEQCSKQWKELRRVKTRPLPKKQKKQLSLKLVKSALKKQIETEMLLENMLDFLTESLKNLKTLSCLM